ncbi:MAG: response regulator transcription factor, partial [Ignavibacteriae bacterium]|nr:response regulator transcription factor [Ignavibacteriota bacterium]
AGTEQVPDSQKLDELKQRFGIAPEESAQLEPRMLALLQRYSSKRRILVADDEKLLLSSVADLLQGHGFHVITAGTVEDALEKVMKFPVDLILSDIKFGADDLDGFKFFDAVQRVPALCSIPFIFMSSLREGVIVRSGMLMGIDDYLTKPLDPELLLAVIEGKLRRARSTAMRQKT